MRQYYINWNERSFNFRKDQCPCPRYWPGNAFPIPATEARKHQNPRKTFPCNSVILCFSGKRTAAAAAAAIAPHSCHGSTETPKSTEVISVQILVIPVLRGIPRSNVGRIKKEAGDNLRSSVFGLPSHYV